MPNFIEGAFDDYTWGRLGFIGPVWNMSLSTACPSQRRPLVSKKVETSCSGQTERRVEGWHDVDVDGRAVMRGSPSRLGKGAGQGGTTGNTCC